MSARTDVLLWANRVMARKGSAPHVLLEIGEESTPQQVQEAFHKVARTSHPDLHRHGLNADELELVTSAYATVAGAYQEMRSTVIQALRMRAIKPGEDFGTFTPSHPKPITPSEGTRAPATTRTPTRPDFAPAAPKPTTTRTPTKPDFAPAAPKPTTTRTPTKPDFAAAAPKPGRGPSRNDFTPPPEPKPTRNDFGSTEPRAPRAGFPRAGTGSDPPASEPKPGRGPTRNDFGSSPPGRPKFPRAGTGSDPPEPRPANVKASGSSPPASALKPASGSQPPGSQPPGAANPITPLDPGTHNAASAMSSKALLYYRKAELCLARGDLRGAVLQLKLACAADPTSAFLRTALAEVEIEVRGKP